MKGDLIAEIPEIGDITQILHLLLSKIIYWLEAGTANSDYVRNYLWGGRLEELY